jgi:hypothetical protein
VGGGGALNDLIRKLGHIGTVEGFLLKSFKKKLSNFHVSHYDYGNTTCGYPYFLALKSEIL